MIKKVTRILHVFLIGVLFTLPTFGQALALDILNGRSKVTIPFTFRQGFIIVDLNYQFFIPMSFIFDTGAQNTIIFDKSLTDLIQTNYEKEINLLGADYSTEIPAFIARQIRLSSPVSKIIVQRDIIVLKEDIAKLGEVVGQEIHGILGSNFFKGMIVEIDYRYNQITIYDPRRFNPKRFKNYYSKELKVIDSKPYINASTTIDHVQNDSLLYLIDTGASLPLLFQVNEDNRIRIPEGTLKGALGKGLGGELMGYVGKIDTFKLIDNLSVITPISYFQELDTSYTSKELVRDGIIGNAMLERFDIVIDYHNSRFYFKPNKKFKQPFKYDKSGLSIIATGPNLRTFVVNRVRPESPGDKAGLRQGDEIIGLNWRPKFLVNLDILNKLFTKKANTKIKLRVRRKDKNLKMKLVLEELF